MQGAVARADPDDWCRADDAREEAVWEQAWPEQARGDEAGPDRRSLGPADGGRARCQVGRPPTIDAVTPGLVVLALPEERTTVVCPQARLADRQDLATVDARWSLWGGREGMR